MKLRVLYLILFLTIAGIGECRSHAGGKQIRLSLDTLMQKEFPSRYLPRVKHMWVNKSDSALADSILYNIGLYNVVVKKDREKILYSICKKYNPEISGEYLVSFQIDSIKKYHDMYCCLGNYAHNGKSYEYYLIPNFGSLAYSDRRINQLPVTYAYQRSRHAVWNNHDILVYENPGDNVRIELRDMRTGKKHRFMTVDGMGYKSSYSVGDSVAIGSACYSLDSIGVNWDFLYLSEKEIRRTVVPETVMDKLAACFKRNDYLLVDFWGTWCNPCIAGFSDMKVLHDEISGYCSLVGVCYDSKRNIAKMDSLLSVHGIGWKNIFDDDSAADNPESIVRKLNIRSFPTYLLINRKDEVLLMDSGIVGFRNLRRYLVRLAKRKNN
mgnify:CR=1 FL=1